ncbi:hypothetical protein [Symmachiella dynata]|uniref:Uncharacterized protein n=1 Tax=Symmachiella dynata TaxID=2527995 RepID=A0A517ZNR9_9PLAN|nr:hypothetical protein [Symmachiella dynata]QDT48510.1 hypothetical protein Pan258_25520 [Symmachiella dynata]QDU44101.1 hypothetical protein Mal52_25790 [Symmachiella dynata]
MKSAALRVSATAFVVMTVSLFTSTANAQDMYWRVGPSFIAPAPYTYQYGMVGSPPPYYIYDPAPVVYAVPTAPVYVQPAPVYVEPAPVYTETIPVGVYDYGYRFDYSLKPSYRYSTRHYRMDYKIKGRTAYGAHVRYRYSYNRGRLKAKLRIRR